jgi:alkanesulfonate monooxygenase SsuD/methylene tetrahydromethanopterin reductase-like flavin-dependent oxidoreductase (luciferase family)
LERYINVGREHGYALSGADFMIERFIFIGDSERAAQQNFERTCVAFGRFQKSLSGDGRFTLPPSVQSSDAQPAATSAPVGPPPDAVVTGTPDQVAAALEQTLASTGARRLMVEAFSNEEIRLFAREVMPRVRRAAPVIQGVA